MSLGVSVLIKKLGVLFCLLSLYCPLTHSFRSLTTAWARHTTRNPARYQQSAHDRTQQEAPEFAVQPSEEIAQLSYDAHAVFRTIDNLTNISLQECSLALTNFEHYAPDEQHKFMIYLQKRINNIRAAKNSLFENISFLQIKMNEQKNVPGLSDQQKADITVLQTLLDNSASRMLPLDSILRGDSSTDEKLKAMIAIECLNRIFTYIFNFLVVKTTEQLNK